MPVKQQKKKRNKRIWYTSKSTVIVFIVLRVLIALTAVLLGAIIFYMFWKRPAGKFFYIVVGLIVGGGVGNLIDRVLYGYVVDYLSLTFFQPVCNFADYCITIGVFLLAVYLLFVADRQQKDIRHDNT